ncbi:hypothetical protein ACGF5S_31890 [Nocardia nova]|uniref:hypothetical protein n=1 Tax=Nocardia nova TaxID=37330 RepID=UPI00372074F0
MTDDNEDIREHVAAYHQRRIGQRLGLSGEALEEDSVEDLRRKSALVEGVKRDLKNAHGEFRDLSMRERRLVFFWLTDRQRRIEALIQNRSQQEQLAAIKEQVDKVLPEPAARHGIDAALSEAKAENEKLIRELRDRDDEDARERKRLENWRTKMETRMGMLQCEPAAILLGGGLAVAIALVMMVGMFMHVETPEVLVNAFLLILGFFFGQNASGGTGSGKSD